ncbi:MAG: hypothetical protein JXR94_18445 [Candidatus Hydrogenedentes bacterium]|nr:hypothetical protein [Candidatus Hydrogenedentota bacterium]
MRTRPRIGLLFLAGESWWEAGICDAVEGPYAGFVQKVEADTARAVAVLKGQMDVVSSGLLHTEEQVVEAARTFEQEGIDGLVFCPIIWTNDPPVIALIRAMRRVPLLLWAYDPYDGFPEHFRIEEWLRASGPVSVQQSANIFRRFGWDYEIAFGNENNAQALGEIVAFARAAAVKRRLVGTRIAVLPAPCNVVASTWIDDFALLETFGIELVYVPVDRLAMLVQETSESKAADYVEWLRENCHMAAPAHDEGFEDVLVESARQALALVRLAEQEGLAGIALDDFNPDLCRILGFRPHLYHPTLGELGCTVGLEADVLGVLATIIAGRLAGRMAMFNEFFSIDPAENTVLMGHPGMGELSMGDPETFTVTPDLEFDETQDRGAWVSYRAKPGPMTFLNMTPEHGRIKVAVWTGESLPGPRIMEGYSHMLVKPDGEARALFKRVVGLGLLQHWGTVHGNVAAEIGCLMRMLGLDVDALTP